MSTSSKDYIGENIDVFEFVPNYLQNELNSSFSRNLFNKFLTKEESVSVFGIVTDKDVSASDSRPLVPQQTLERAINGLIPLINAKHGTEDIVLSFSDVIAKAKLLGIDVSNFADWGACQSFNFIPPIDLDKFINFSSYFWVGALSKSSFKPSWNEDLLPEYYVIGKPKINDKIKFPAEIASNGNLILTGSGHINERWIVTFIDANNFKVIGETSGFGGSFASPLGDNGSVNTIYQNQYVTFFIGQGTKPFVAGDKFFITTEDLTGNYSYTFSGIGNGPISGIKGAQEFQIVGGVKTYDGMRVLVKNQNDISQNGIYIVRSGNWELADDGNTINSQNGIEIYVSNGQEKGLWVSPEFNQNKIFVKASDTSLVDFKNVSDWTEFNFWVHRDDLLDKGYDINLCTQAIRPIIEYNFELEMNTDAKNGKPLGSNSLLNNVQRKTKFNQLPLFNLYLANKEFAGKVSPIFFYEESDLCKVDSAMKRRIFTDENGDYVFSNGCVLQNKSILFFKNNSEFKSIWAPGPKDASISKAFLDSPTRQLKAKEVDVLFSNVLSTIRHADWVAKADSNNSFVLSSEQYPSISINVNLDEMVDVYDNIGNRLFSIEILSDAALLPIDGLILGDVIKFKSLNKEASRYVNGQYLGSALDVEVDAELRNGVWTTPFQLEFNPYHENRKSIRFGDLINHFTSIIAAQPGFYGSSFGRNNFRDLENKLLGIGGTIKEHNGPFNTLIGLLNLENISPLSIIDFAETQYSQALNSVVEFVNSDLVALVSSYGAPAIDSNSIDSSGTVNEFINDYMTFYKSKVDVSSYLSSSTSIMPNWPATLPMFGLSGKVHPTIRFDNELGIDVIVHHDGHLSPKNSRNIDFNRNLTKQKVLRSDGNETAGVFSVSAPSLPYKNQLWFNSNTGELKVYDIKSDLAAPSTGETGDFWFNRQSNILYTWNSIQSTWVNESDKSLPWKTIEPSEILNAMILEIETRLFNSISANQGVIWNSLDFATAETLKFELSKFSAKYGYDPLGSDFNSNDPFTWNYSNTNFPEIGQGNARWSEIYKEYFASVLGNTALATCRPNLEPWKLLGFSTKPSTFDTTYNQGVTQIDPAKTIQPVNLVLHTPVNNLAECPLVIDEIEVSINDRVLITSGTNIGIFRVVSKDSTSLCTIVQTNDSMSFAGANVLVKNGYAWANTTWVSNGSEFTQNRKWSMQLWADILSQHPTIKLCVNVFTEELLAPYVDPLSVAAPYGLTNSIPSSAQMSYEFGQSGPTEIVWQKSLEFAYSLIRASIKNQPLKFIDATWGDVNRSVDDLEISKQESSKTSQKDVILHGEPIPVKNRTGIIYSSVLPVIGEGVKIVRLVCDFITSEKDFFAVYVDGIYYGHLDDFDPSCKVDFSQLVISDGGYGFNIGDEIRFEIHGTGSPGTFDDVLVSDGLPDYDIYGWKNGDVFDGLPVLDAWNWNNAIFQTYERSGFDDSISGNVVNVEFIPATVKKVVGVNQWFTQVMKYNSFSLANSKNNTLFRKWDINLGYRFGSFMNAETLTLESSKFDIPLGMCNLVTKVSPYANSEWINALRIQLVSVGSTELVDGIYKPMAFGDDWVFRVETYFPKHPTISYYDVITSVTTDGVTSEAPFMTFKALEGRRTPEIWKNYSVNGAVQSIDAPFFIRGIQNTINFLYGYTRLLTDRGWEINQSKDPAHDEETGRIITWQLEIEKFVDSVYNNMVPGNGYVFNPFMESIWFKTNKGLVSKFDNINFLDSSASQFVFDVLGSQVPVENLKIVREEDTTMVISDSPMFGLRVNTELYENAIVFPYYLDNAKKQKLIYDPYLGVRIHKLGVAGSRQAVLSGRPSFGGFFLDGNKMQKNIVATIDDFGKMYDAEAMFENPTVSRNALALFGFSEQKYFKDIGISRKNQFNFWRGMIQSKGTNSSIDSFLNNALYEDAKIDEYWAFKIAEYGDARIKSFPELKLLASDAFLDTSRFQFYDAQVPSSSLPGFTQVSSLDESRWLNIDDIQELQERGMYFDAISLGIFQIEEKPQFLTSIQSGGNTSGRLPVLVTHPTSAPKVKVFMPTTSLRVVFSDVLNFKVYKILSQNNFSLIGNGMLGVPFETTEFSFTLVNGLAPVVANDIYILTISETIFKPIELPFFSDKLVITVDGVQIDTTQSNSYFDIVSQKVIVAKRANVKINIEGFGPQKPKFSPIKFFDYKNDTFLGNIPFWHPALGQHTPEAFEIINITSEKDPAKYNQTTKTTYNANYDMLKPWGSKEVGKVWWNTKNLDYLPYFDPKIYPSIENRLSKWGSLAEFSNVEVYEWIESDVPPSEYAAAVLSDASNSSIPQEQKKSGELANTKLLTRFRTWSVRPVAWKHNERVGDSVFFTSALFNKIRLTSFAIGTSRAILNFGKFSDFGITSGMSLAGWDFIDNIPLGHASILSTVDYVIGSETQTFAPSLVQPHIQGSYDITDVDGNVTTYTNYYYLVLTIDKSTRLSSIGKTLGKINFSYFEQDSSFFISAVEENTGKSQTISIRDITFSKSGFTDYDFTEMGFMLRLSAPSVSQPTLFSAQNIATAVGNVGHDVYIRESIDLDIDIPFPDEILVNDTSDFDSQSHGYGWRAWIDPTQADLSSDIVSPDNLWVPIYGDWQEINDGGLNVPIMPTGYMQRISSYQNEKLQLNDGTYVEKYKSDWSDFSELSDIQISFIFDGNTSSKIVDFSYYFDSLGILSSGIDQSRLNVYVNGVLQQESQISVKTFNVTINPLTASDVGAKVTIIYKKYQPSNEELSFNPDVSDNILVNTQYKHGYDFTVKEVRDANDKLSSSLYYFWVKNKNTSVKGRKMSIAQAKSLLTFGPSLYMTFHNIQNEAFKYSLRSDPTIVYDSIQPTWKNAFGNPLTDLDFVFENNTSDETRKYVRQSIMPIRYDSVSIFGLNKIVNIDDAYKIRFTRNFTLRDDPNELDLKNVHSEWTLLRPLQNARIPFTLWNKLVETAIGEDAAGNKLPSAFIADYDAKHGTSNRFGLGVGQILSEQKQIIESIKFTILNTSLLKTVNGAEVPDYIEKLSLSNLDKYFNTNDETRKTLDLIWREAKPKQINEIFFNVINDALANNFEFKDIFKTSRLSVYSIKKINQTTGQNNE